MSPPIRRTKGLPSRLPPGTRTLDTRCNKRAPPRQAPSSWSQREVFNLLCNPTRDDNLLSARPGHATGWLGLLAVFDADFSRRTARHNTPRCRLNGSGASGTMPAAEKGELVHKGTGHSRRHTATSTGGAAACAMATSAGCIFFSPHSPSLTQAKMRRKAAVPWSLAAFGDLVELPPVPATRGICKATLHIRTPAVPAQGWKLAAFLVTFSSTAVPVVRPRNSAGSCPRCHAANTQHHTGWKVSVDYFSSPTPSPRPYSATPITPRCLPRSDIVGMQQTGHAISHQRCTRPKRGFRHVEGGHREGVASAPFNWVPPPQGGRLLAAESSIRQRREVTSGFSDGAGVKNLPTWPSRAALGRDDLDYYAGRLWLCCCVRAV
jgi:hypothetical protein